MRIVKGMLLGNVLLAFVFAFLYGRSCLWSGVAVSACYTELDRRGVIDEEALRAFDPALAENSRYTVPRWLAEYPMKNERTYAVIGCSAAIANALLVCSVGVRLQRAKVRGDGLGAGTENGGPSRV
jgi:hypothetical protein